MLPCTSKWNVDLESGLDQIQGLEQKSGACSTTATSNKRFHNWWLKQKIKIYRFWQSVTTRVAWPLIAEKIYKQRSHTIQDPMNRKETYQIHIVYKHSIPKTWSRIGSNWNSFPNVEALCTAYNEGHLPPTFRHTWS